MSDISLLVQVDFCVHSPCPLVTTCILEKQPTNRDAVWTGGFGGSKIPHGKGKYWWEMGVTQCNIQATRPLSKLLWDFMFRN